MRGKKKKTGEGNEKNGNTNYRVRDREMKAETDGKTRIIQIWSWEKRQSKKGN